MGMELYKLSIIHSFLFEDGGIFNETLLFSEILVIGLWPCYPGNASSNVHFSGITFIDITLPQFEFLLTNFSFNYLVLRRTPISAVVIIIVTAWAG